MSFQTAFRFRDYKDVNGQKKPNPPAEKIYGPISSIGPLTVCAYLVETPDGLILIDTGYDRDADLLPDNIRALNLDPKNIKLILLTHWHSDHAGGAARLVKLSGAKVMIHEKDADVVETGKYNGKDVVPPTRVDRRLKDGEIVEHAGLAFQTIHCPGQSAGEVVYLATLPGPDGPCRTLFAGDATGFKDGVPELERLGYPGVCADFRKTVQTLRNLHFDLYLGGHPHQVFKESRPDGNPFITRDQYLNLVNTRHDQMEHFVQQHPKYLDW